MHQNTEVGAQLAEKASYKLLSHIQDVIIEFEKDPRRCVEAYTLSCAFGTSKNTSEKVAHIKAYNDRHSTINSKGLAERVPQLRNTDRRRVQVSVNNVQGSIMLPRDVSRVGFEKGKKLYFELYPALKSHRLYTNQFHTLRHQAVMLKYIDAVTYHVKSRFACNHVSGWCLFNNHEFQDILENTTVDLYVINQPDAYPSVNGLTSNHTQITSNIDGWHEDICGSSYTSWVTALWQGGDKNNPISNDVVSQMSRSMRALDESNGLTLLNCESNLTVSFKFHSLWKCDWPAFTSLCLHSVGE